MFQTKTINCLSNLEKLFQNSKTYLKTYFIRLLIKKLIYLIVAIAILGLIVSGCSIPLKSVIPTSEKVNPKPEPGTPTLEKITFIHYAKSSGRSKPVGDDTVDKYKLLFGGVKWPATMKYWVNPTDSGLEETGEVLNALSASLDTWNTAITGEFKLFETPEEDDSVYYSKDRDFTNTVTWGELPWVNAIAMCAFWFNPVTKEILESDVVFSTDFSWSVDGTDSSDKMELQSIATHEFGHNGLNDLYIPPSTELTMYGYSSLGETKKRDLGTGDISGIRELYGE